MDGLVVHRPLLGSTRVEIEEWRRKEGIKYREDASNAELHHTRNKIRHSVIPAISMAMGFSFGAAVLRAAEISRMEEDWMAGLVPEPGPVLDCKILRSMHPALRSRFVLRWLRSAGVPEAGWAETKRTIALLENQSPAKASLPGGFHVRRRAGVLFLEAP